MLSRPPVAQPASGASALPSSWRGPRDRPTRSDLFRRRDGTRCLRSLRNSFHRNLLVPKRLLTVTYTPREAGSHCLRTRCRFPNRCVSWAFRYLRSGAKSRKSHSSVFRSESVKAAVRSTLRQFETHAEASMALNRSVNVLPSTTQRAPARAPKPRQHLPKSDGRKL